MCTDLILPFGNPYVSGRTMDFHGTLNARMQKIPVGRSFTSKAPDSDGKPTRDGKSWTAEYGFVGVNYREVDMYSDGLNTEGLSVGLLWLSSTRYAEPRSRHARKCVAITDAVAYFLSLCTSVDQVRSALDDIVIWGCVEPVLGEVPPALHIVAHDREGRTLVIEFIDKETVCHEYSSAMGHDASIPVGEKGDAPPTGVLTNDPPYPRQLSEYYAFRKENPTLVPGGTSSEDRFRRASILRSLIPERLPHDHIRYSSPASLDQQRVQFTVQLLNRVEITEMEYMGTTIDAYTIWSIVRDHSNNILYWFDNMNHNLRAIELEKLNFDNGEDDEVYLSAGDWSTSLTVALSR